MIIKNAFTKKSIHQPDSMIPDLFCTAKSLRRSILSYLEIFRDNTDTLFQLRYRDIVLLLAMMMPALHHISISF